MKLASATEAADRAEPAAVVHRRRGRRTAPLTGAGRAGDLDGLAGLDEAEVLLGDLGDHLDAAVPDDAKELGAGLDDRAEDGAPLRD